MEEWDISITCRKKSGIDIKELERIAKKCGYKIIRRGENDNIYGVEAVKNKVGHPKKNLSKNEIIALREKGNTVKDICKALGVARSTVYNYLGKDYPKKQ